MKSFLNKLTLKKIKDLFQDFLALPKAEKKWVLRHPIAASRIPPVKTTVEQVIGKKYKNNELDASYSDGQLDALRHALWMALTARRIGVKKARSLGIAHEKGNKENALKKIKEDGSLADHASTAMDLRNNEAGLRIAQENPGISVKKLIKTIEQQIMAGKLWIVKQDEKGFYLSWEGRQLKENDYKGNWQSPRCIVPSDYNLKEKL